MARPAGGAGHSSLHRHGLRLLACSGCRLGAAVAAASGAPKPIACPGQATTFWGKVAITGHALFATDCDWTQFDLGWMFTLFFVVLGSAAAIWGGWLEREGPRKAAFVAALCWCGGLVISAFGVYRPSALAPVARLGRDRRHWSRPRLYFAGLDPGEMVPGSARHGDRHGDHGLWRRRHDRLAAGDDPDERFQDRDDGRRLADLPGHGGDLFLLHDRRRFRLSAAAGRLAARRLDGADAKDRHDRPWRRAARRRAQDAAVLAHLAGADA